MVDYERLAAVAKRLIETNGRDVTLYRNDRAPADAAKPWRGPDGTPTPPDGLVIGPVKIAFVPASGSGFGRALFDSSPTLRKKIDQVGLLATDSITALTFTADDVERVDTLKDGSKLLKIVEIGHLKPGSRSLIYVLGLKI